MAAITAAAVMIAAICLGAMIALWFSLVRRALAEKRESALTAQQQLRLHSEGLERVRGSDSESAARRALEASREVCSRVCESYNLALQRPVCVIPARIMGFRPL